MRGSSACGTRVTSANPCSAAHSVHPLGKPSATWFRYSFTDTCFCLSVVLHQCKYFIFAFVQEDDPCGTAINLCYISGFYSVNCHLGSGTLFSNFITLVTIVMMFLLFLCCSVQNRLAIL